MALSRRQRARRTVIWHDLLQVEGTANETDINPDANIASRIANTVYIALAQLTGGGGFAPVTAHGKCLLVTYSFLILLLVAG